MAVINGAFSPTSSRKGRQSKLQGYELIRLQDKKKPAAGARLLENEMGLYFSSPAIENFLLRDLLGLSKDLLLRVIG